MMSDAAFDRPPARNGATVDPPALQALLPVLIGLALAVALFGTWLGDDDGFDAAGLADFALGRYTQSVYAGVGGAPIHIDGNPERLEEWLEGWRARGARPVVVWLGNSQLHGVNRYEPGQRTVAARAFDALDGLGFDTLVVSPPSATPLEHYLLYEHVAARVPVAMLIVGEVFMNLRSHNVRAEMHPYLADAKTAAELSGTAAGRNLQRRFSEYTQTGSDAEGVVVDTPQDRVERTLNDWLQTNSQRWAMRGRVRAQITTSWVRLYRSLFRIGPQTKRPMVAGSYETNMRAIDAMLAAAASDGVAILAYVAPIRQTPEPPVVLEEYRGFKHELAAMTERHGGRFADLELVVPDELFGFHGSATVFEEQVPDYWHFQEGGHRLLAESVLEEVESDLRRPDGL